MTDTLNVISCVPDSTGTSLTAACAAITPLAIISLGGGAGSPPSVMCSARPSVRPAACARSAALARASSRRLQSLIAAAIRD